MQRKDRELCAGSQPDFRNAVRGKCRDCRGGEIRKLKSYKADIEFENKENGKAKSEKNEWNYDKKDHI